MAQLGAPNPQNLTQAEFDELSDPRNIEAYDDLVRIIRNYQLQVGMPTRPLVYPLPAEPANNPYNPLLPENQFRDPEQPQQIAAPQAPQQPQQPQPPQAAQAVPQGPPPQPQQPQPQQLGAAAPLPYVPAALVGGQAQPHVLPIAFHAPAVNDLLVAPLIKEFEKKIGKFSGFMAKDPMHFFIRADAFFKEKGLQSLEAARVFTENTTSDAQLFITQIQDVNADEMDEEEAKLYENARYWGPQPYFPGRVATRFRRLTWGTHEVTELTRRDSCESLAEIFEEPAQQAVVVGDQIADEANPGQLRDALAADVRDAVPAVAARPYMKGRKGWSRVQPKAESNFVFLQDLPELRREPLVTPDKNLRAYVVERYQKKPDPRLAERFLKCIDRQSNTMLTSVHLTLLKRVFGEFWRHKHDQDTIHRLGDFGEHYKASRLAVAMESLNPAFKRYLEASISHNPANKIVSYTQLQAKAREWEQTSDGTVFFRSCVEFVPYKPPTQGAKISSLSAAELFNIDGEEEPDAEPDTQGAATNAAATTATRGRGAARGRGTARGAANAPNTPGPYSIAANPKAPDGQFEYVQHNGEARRVDGNQPLCNFCGIKSHPRSKCIRMKQFRLEGKQAMFHPDKETNLALAPPPNGSQRGRGGRGGRGRGSRGGRGRGQGGQPSQANTSAAAVLQQQNPFMQGYYVPIQNVYQQDPRATWMTQAPNPANTLPPLPPYRPASANGQQQMMPPNQGQAQPNTQTSGVPPNYQNALVTYSNNNNFSPPQTCPLCYTNFANPTAFYEHMQQEHGGAGQSS